MDHSTSLPLPLPLPPPMEPAAENPPKKADSESHNYSEESSRAMQNFRALMLRLAVASSPNNSLTPSQNLIFEDMFRQCFPSIKSPDHPPYAWMIITTIEKLKEEGGSSEGAISECIMNDNRDLPWAHATLLKHHLDKLCERGDIVQTQDGLYLLKDRTPPVPLITNSPSSPSAATNSPTCSLSFSPSLDSLNSYSSSGSSMIKQKWKRKMKRKPKKVVIKRKGRAHRSGMRQKNTRLKQKRKVRGRGKKGKRKQKVSSDEEGINASEADNQMEWQKTMVDAGEELHTLEAIKQDAGQEETRDMSEQDALEVPIPTNVGAGPQNPVVEARSDAIEAENVEEEEQEMMKGQSPSRLEHDDIELEMDRQNDPLEEQIQMSAEEKSMELQELVDEEHEMLKEQNRSRLEHSDSELGVDEQNDPLEEQIQMNAEAKTVELQELGEEACWDNQQNVQGENNTLKENLPLRVENQVQEQKAMEQEQASHCSSYDEDRREEMNAEKEVIAVQGWDVEEQINSNESQREEGAMVEWHQSMEVENNGKQWDKKAEKMDWKHEIVLALSQTEITNSVDRAESQKEQRNRTVIRKYQNWSGKETVHSPKSSSFPGEGKAVPAHNTDEPGTGRCLRSGKRLDAVQASIGSKHEETCNIKQNDQQEEEQIDMAVDPEIESSNEEVSSPHFPEDSKGEQQNHHRQLRSRVPKTEPGTEEKQDLQSASSLQTTRRVTRQMAAATSCCISPLVDEQQTNKLSKSQEDEVSSIRRRSTRLSIGQSKK